MVRQVWKLKSCQKCRGDLLWADEEWRCWQCGRCYYVPNMPASASGASSSPLDAARSAFQQWDDGSDDRQPSPQERDRRTGRRQEFQWWARNRAIATLLDRGYTAREVASRTGHTPQRVQQIARELDQFQDAREEVAFGLAAD